MSVVTTAMPESRRARLTFENVALAALLSTFLLIVMGSLVRVTGYGLGCPDWPLCYGQIVPPFDIAPWFEFTHRLIGAATSVQIVGLGVWAWRTYRRVPHILHPAVAAVVLLVAQVALGGLHVIYELPAQTGWIHTGVAMALTGLMGALVAVTHPLARALSARAALAARDRGLPALVAATAVATYFLILTGAYVTRSGAALVCPSFPECGASSPALQSLIDIQMLHRFSAYGVALLAGLTVWRLVRIGGGEPGWRAAAFALAALVIVQFGLGISNVLLRLPLWSRILHLLVAALLWTGLVMVWVVVRIQPRPAGHPHGEYGVW